VSTLGERSSASTAGGSARPRRRVFTVRRRAEIRTREGMTPVATGTTATAGIPRGGGSGLTLT